MLGNIFLRAATRNSEMLLCLMSNLNMTIVLHLGSYCRLYGNGEYNGMTCCLLNFYSLHRIYGVFLHRHWM